jgi:hypothetical protein
MGLMLLHVSLMIGLINDPPLLLEAEVATVTANFKPSKKTGKAKIEWLGVGPRLGPGVGPGIGPRLGPGILGP